jgi:hypothetical protein
MDNYSNLSDHRTVGWTYTYQVLRSRSASFGSLELYISCFSPRFRAKFPQQPKLSLASRYTFTLELRLGERGLTIYRALLPSVTRTTVSTAQKAYVSGVTLCRQSENAFVRESVVSLELTDSRVQIINTSATRGASKARG